MDLPSHLAQTSAQGAREGEPVAQFEIGAHRNFVYLILDWSSRKAAVVDPQLDLTPWENVVKKHGFELEAVFLTHTHSDHTAGVPETIRRYPDIAVHVHKLDSRRLPPAVRSRTKFVVDGETVNLGALEVRVLHTPGHSIGECSYLFETDRPYLFTGDTIFIRDCGRTDLDTGDNEQMFESIQRVKAMPPETVILPGHHYARECASTVGRELRESPPFKCRSVDELAALP